MADFRENYTDAAKRLNGSCGFLKIDGVPWCEVTAVSISIEPTFGEVKMGLDTGYKLMGRKGSGTVKITKAFSRMDSWTDKVKRGKTPTFTLEALLKDPDATANQFEQVEINECVPTKIDDFTFEHGSMVDVEIPFNFQASNYHKLSGVYDATGLTAETF